MVKMEILHLTPSERGELQSYLKKRNLPASAAALRINQPQHTAPDGVHQSLQYIEEWPHSSLG